MSSFWERPLPKESSFEPLDSALAGGLSVLAPTADGRSVAFNKLELSDVPCAAWVSQLPRLTHVTDFALEGASMSDEESEQLLKLELLTKLNLCRNALTKLPVDASSVNSFLQVIKLSHNNITDAAVDLTSICPTLHSLDLSHNQLTALKGLKTTEALKVLNLSSNQLPSLSGLVCPGLITLNAADNQLAQLEDKEVTKFKKYQLVWAKAFAALEELDVEGNKLGEGGNTITGFTYKGAFPKLSTLKLGRNLIQDYLQLRNLADWWSHEDGLEVLPSLRKLTLFKNPNTDPERVWEPPEPPELAEGEEPAEPAVDPVAPFDEAKYAAEVLCYLPSLVNLDAMPQRDEEGEMLADFGTEEQLEQATEIRIALVTAEKEAKAVADAEAARIEAERVAAEEAAALLAAEEAAAAAEAAAEEAALEAAEDDE